MQLNIKKINYYVKKNGITVLSLSDDRLAFSEAALIKKEFPYDTVEVSMSNLYGIENPAFFSKSFWCDKKRRTPTLDSAALVTDLVYQATRPSPNAPWINTTEYSTPVYYADKSTPRVPMSIIQNGIVQITALNTEVQKGVPIRDDFIPAAGSDGSITIIDETGKLWEFWKFEKINGKYQAAWGGIINNVYESNGVVPKTNGELWGGTATSLPIIGGTMLMDELESGIIPHMLAFSTQNPKWAFIPPALRTDGQQNGATGLIPAGQIFQFPENIVINAAWTPMTKMMVTAVRDYGMIQRDRSGCVAFYAEDILHRGLGKEPYKAYYGGKALWDVIAEFPFNKLQAVSF